MTGIGISLLIIGCIFMVGSFFVSEKLSTKEINRIAELSDEELKRIISKGMEKASNQIENVVEDKVDEVSEKVEIALEKESNLKIMAISEYSDTVMENMKKTHDEIMFLYSMLNDKHTEMTSLTGNLQRLAADIRNLQEGIQGQKPVAVAEQADVVDTLTKSEKKEVNSQVKKSKKGSKATKTAKEKETDLDVVTDLENHNDMILALHKEGLSKVEIAKQLNLGVGEVSLVIGLYKGDE